MTCIHGRSAVYQAVHSNSIASVKLISLDLAMQSLYDGRYAVYMPDYSIYYRTNAMNAMPNDKVQH